MISRHLSRPYQEENAWGTCGKPEINQNFRRTMVVDSKKHNNFCFYVLTPVLEFWGSQV